MTALPDRLTLPSPSDMTIAEMLAEARVIIRSLNDLNDRMLERAAGATDA